MRAAVVAAVLLVLALAGCGECEQSPGRRPSDSPGVPVDPRGLS